MQKWLAAAFLAAVCVVAASFGAASAGGAAPGVQITVLTTFPANAGPAGAAATNTGDVIALAARKIVRVGPSGQQNPLPVTLPAGFFGIGTGVEFRPWLIPSVMFGLGGGPDGATIALGNEACLFRSGWFEARAFGYWANAFGRDEQDEFSQGYRTLTESSRSLKLGGAIGVYTSKDLCFAVRAGYSWALNVPLVTKETPTGTSTQPSDDPYFRDGMLFGLSMCARL